MSLRRNVVANYLGQGWVALMGIAFVPLYVQALGVESYGLVGVFAVLQAWLAMLDLGLTPTLNREMARLRAGAHSAESIRDLMRSLEFIFLGLATAMVVTVWFGGPFLVTGWLRTNDLSQTVLITAIRIMGFVLATRWLEQVYRAALLGMQDQVWLNLSQAILATLRWGGAYFVVTFLTPTIAAFFVWQGVISLLTSVVLLLRTYTLLPRADRTGRFNTTSLREVKKFATGMFMSAILSFALMQADKIIISNMLPLEQLGLYMLAATASGGLLQLVAPMNNAIYPLLTMQVTGHKHPDLSRTYHRACEWMAAVTIPPALLLALFAGPVMMLWTGDMRLTGSVATILTLLALGTLCNAVMNLPYMLQLAHGWTSLAVGKNIVAVSFAIPAIIWAIPRYGAAGAAGVWFVVNLGYVIFEPYLMHRRLLQGTKWLWYRNAILLPIGAGTLVGVALLASLPPITDRTSAFLTVALSMFLLVLAVSSALPAVRHDVKMALMTSARYMRRNKRLP